MDEILRNIAVYALPVLLAITLHEAAHAYAAKYFGDTTAYAAGRMSMNPLKHIDPFGTVLLPLMLFYASSKLEGGFVFGYAKPVPVEFSKLRNPKRDMAWVALAGPAANFVMAFGWLVLNLIVAKAGMGAESFPFQVAQAGVWINLLLFAFNLLPIPPLDGGRILTSMLPNRLAYKFAGLEHFGFFIVLAMLFLGLLHYWVVPLVQASQYVLDLLAFPFKLLLN
jgi:Zn-dependent protease